MGDFKRLFLNSFPPNDVIGVYKHSKIGVFELVLKINKDAETIETVFISQFGAIQRGFSIPYQQGLTLATIQQAESTLSIGLPACSFNVISHCTNNVYEENLNKPTISLRNNLYKHKYYHSLLV